jgi:hypothetical protein
MILDDELHIFDDIKRYRLSKSMEFFISDEEKDFEKFVSKSI